MPRPEFASISIELCTTKFHTYWTTVEYNSDTDTILDLIKRGLTDIQKLHGDLPVTALTKTRMELHVDSQSPLLTERTDHEVQ